MEIGFEQTSQKRNDNINTRFNVKSRSFLSQTENSKENNDNTEYFKPKYTCFNCKKDHSLFYYPDFLKLAIKDCISRIKALQLCCNCLRRNHPSTDCKWNRCKICGDKHNTVLHESKQSTNSAVAVNQESVPLAENTSKK